MCLLCGDVQTAPYYKDNRVHTEGLLLNDAFFVTKKVILPYGRSDVSVKPEIGYSCKEKLTDIEKALCFVFVSRRRRHTRSSTVSWVSEMCIRDRPTDEPVTLTEIKDHLHVSSTAEDSLLALYAQLSLIHIRRCRRAV